MYKYFLLERRKFKGSFLFWFFTFAFIATLGFLSLNMLSGKFSQGGGENPMAWLQILDQYFFTRLILYPILIAAVIGQAVSIENDNNMWKVLYSSGLDFKKIYRVKFFNIYLKFFLFQCLEWIAFILYAKAVGVTAAIPIGRFVLYFSTQLSITFALLSIHYLLSLKWSNQLISTSISIIGSLLGIIFVFLPKEISFINPYTWYGTLMSIRYIPKNGEWLQSVWPLNYTSIFLGLVLGLSVFLFGAKIKGEE